MPTKVTMLSSAAILVFSVSTPAFAQLASPQQSQTPEPAVQTESSASATAPVTSSLESTLDDIVVTGRKRDVAERAQDVPIALSAYSGAALEAAHVKDLTDITNLTPGVRLTPSGSVPGYGTFYIRGAGVSGSIPSNDPAVGVFIDGMPLGISTASLTELFDLASVEVLRGPQGTLFGRNVTGGAVLITTKRPDGAFHAEITGGGGSFGSWELGGSVEGGVADNAIAVKLAVLTKHTDGYIRDVGRNKYDGESDTQIVRPTIVFKPTDRLTIAVVGEIGRISGDGPVSSNIAQAGTSATSLAYIPPTGKFDVRLTRDGFSDLSWQHLILNADWNVASGTITSATGYREVSHGTSTDYDGTSLDLFDFSTNVKQHQFFQELRFAGRPFGTDAINLTAGASLLDQKYTYGEGRFIFAGAVQQALQGTINHQQYGVFAQTDIVLPYNFSVTAGARYSYEKKQAAIASLGNCNFALTTCTIDFTGKDSWGNLGPKLGLQWKPNGNFLAYGSWTRGFRSGGYNVRNGSPLVSPGPYNEETVDAYEIGIKSEFLDRRIRFNLAGYINKAEGLQEVVADINLRQTILNAANATTKGVEADVTVIPVRGLVLTASGGYVSAKYDSFNGLDLTGDGVPDPALAVKLQFPNVPKWTYSASATYETRLGSLGAIVLRGSYSHVDARFADVINVVPLNGYDLIDASVALKLKQNVTLTVYGKNLGNERYAVFGTRNTVFRNEFVAPPRTWLAQVSFKY